MLTRCVYAVGGLLLLTTAVAVSGAEQEKLFTNPAKAGRDCEIQGEYLLSGTTPQGSEKYGIQIVALGGGEFVATRFRGGLPGAGADLQRRIRTIAGHTVDGAAVFQERQTVVTFPKSGPVTVKNTLFDALVAKLEKVDRTSPSLGAKPPEGAIVLFDGKSTDQFENAEMTEDGLLKPGAVTKETFRDFTLHLEFRIPFMPFARGKDRGNSGVGLPGGHEVQILDSFGLATPQEDCCGAVCGIAPEINMCFPPLAWQTFDIDFAAVRYDSNGSRTGNARLTLKHNGVVVHSDVGLRGVTANDVVEKKTTGPGPICLAEQGSPVSFRNVWIVKKE